MTQNEAPLAPIPTVPGARRLFHVMVKPTGAMCNLDCEYCFFLSKDRLLREGRAPSELMAAYARADADRGRNEPCTCGSGRKWKKCHGSVRNDRPQADR